MAVILFNKLRKWLSERRFWCNLTAAVVAITVFAPLTFWSLDRQPPFRFSEGYTIPAVVTQGGTYKTSWLVQRHRYCPGTVTVSIVDSQKKITTILALPSYFNQLGENGKTVRAESLPRTMPDSVAVGPAMIFIDNEFYCNKLQAVLRWPIIIKHPPIKTEIIK